MKSVNLLKNFQGDLIFIFFCIYCLTIILKEKNSITITRNYFTCFLLTLFKKKVILEIHHDTNVEGRISKFILKYTNFLNNKHLINIVAITKSVKNLFIRKYKVNSKKITVLPSGSSIEVNRRIVKTLSKNLKIGYFGSLSKSKGINTIIKLSKIDKNNNYYIFGGLKDEIQILKNKNYAKNLFFEKSVPYSSVSKEMIEMDVLLMPYTEKVKSSGDVDDISKYTSPLKLFDYLAVGKIIVTSDLEVLREVISNKNAFFVKNFQNIYEWRMKINEIKNNKIKLAIINKNNFFLSKKFNHKYRVRKYFNFNEI